MGRRRRLAIAATAVGASALGLVALAAAVYRDMPAERFDAPLEPVAGVGRLSAEACAACHPAIYAEWRESAHARAFTDPLYQAELIDQQASFGCHRCHTPLVEQREQRVHGLALALPGVIWEVSTKNDAFQPALRDEGITCVVCHQVDGALAGPFESSDAPHPTMTLDLREPELCQRCHELDLGFVGRKLQRPIMETVSQWKEYRALGGDKRCADCHLPRHEGERPAATTTRPRPATDHRLRGPWEGAFVNTGVLVDDVSIDRGDETLRASLTITNGTGHRLPTAEPGRFITISLRAMDADGKVVREAVERIERPVDVRRLREAPGQETTLAPRERRPLALELEVDATVVDAVLAVDFWRWDPDHEAARHAGLDEAALRHRVFERRVPAAN
jgi:hypothetical protein